MSDAGMEMSNGHMKDVFDVNAQTAMICYTRGVESERRMKARLCLQLEAAREPRLE